MGIYNGSYPTKNFGYPKGTQGRNGHSIVGVGVHISGARWASNLSWIQNPSSNASYNCIVRRAGSKMLLVPERNAAYSHGRVNRPSWPLLKSGVNPNLYTLSIARTGSNQNEWTEKQMDSTVEVIMYWSEKYGFPPRWPYVFGHFHIDSVNRAYCPGEEFFEELLKRLEREEIKKEKKIIEEDDEDMARRNWVPITGDWDGSGKTRVGFYRREDAKVFLNTSNTGGNADIEYYLGPAGNEFDVLVGDWDGDGKDEVGLYDPETDMWYLRHEHAGGHADEEFRFGGKRHG